MSLKIARRVLQTELEALEGLLKRLDQTFEEAVELVFAAPGRVVVTGMGKSSPRPSAVWSRARSVPSS